MVEFGVLLGVLALCGIGWELAKIKREIRHVWRELETERVEKKEYTHQTIHQAQCLRPTTV